MTVAHLCVDITLCQQAAGDEPAASDLVPTARVLVLLTDGRVDSYQVCTMMHAHGWLKVVACCRRLGLGMQANTSMLSFPSC